MKWEQLLSRQRYGQDVQQNKNIEEDEIRNDFEVDFDRVVFSSAFRRLQDKTQVIPLPKHDFVHTRLTHSLEVSVVGRSLGRICGQFVIKKYPALKNELNFTPSNFGSIVAAACLAHDIGNPPFGHSGEKAICNYFLNGNGKKFEAELNDEKKWNDLVYFEGNANGFRMLTNPGNSRPGGNRLTYATLGAFTKYPKESFPRYESKRASEKKFGFFQSEREHFRSIAEILGLKRHRDDKHLNWCRHPLAFLVEAADDICYSIIDFEDGVRLGLLTEQHALDLLKPILGERFKQHVYDDIFGIGEKMSFLRALAINNLINDVCEIFKANEEKILAGEYDKSLIDDSQYIDYVKAIKKITFEKVYRSRNVLEIEAAGFEVLGGLLDAFIEAVNSNLDERSKPKGAQTSYQNQKMFDLIPTQFIGRDRVPDPDLYTRIIRVCEFVAGMTDSYAISLFRRMKGIELPNE
jgi:dGTPase